MKNRFSHLLLAILVVFPFRVQAQEVSYDTIKVVEKQTPAGIYTVSLRYILDKQGHLSDIAAESGWGYGMEEQAIRMLKKAASPWVPSGQQPVHNTKTYHRKYITFIVSHPDFDIRCEGQYVLSPGVPNIIRVTTTRWKTAGLRLKMQGKKIRPDADGQFIFTPLAKPGERIILSLCRTGKKKRLGEVSFEIKSAI